MSFVSIAVLYHLGLTVLDISGNEARAMGLLFSGIVETGGLWPAFGPGALAHVDWTAVAMQIHNVLALILVILLSLVMYLGGIELAANVELEWNREFKAAGPGSLIAGLGGSPPGCLSTSGSIISHKLGAESRLTGVVASLVMGSALIWGDTMLMLIPVPLVGGLLIFIVLVLLDDWLIKSRAARTPSPSTSTTATSRRSRRRWPGCANAVRPLSRTSAATTSRSTTSPRTSVRGATRSPSRT